MTLQSGIGKRIDLLDALRMLAALSVVLYHYAFRSTGSDGGELGPEGVGGYRRKCDEVAEKGYEGFAGHQLAGRQ